MLHVVILAGGSGTRFWPLSRRDRPKQFLALAGSRTLLQQAYDRVTDLTGNERVHVVTGEALAAGVQEQLPDLPEANVIVEPCLRDTAPAIGLAAGLIHAEDPDAVLAVIPSDHVIRPGHAFREALREAEAIAAASPVIVTFGIRAREPRTGYGYIRRGAPLEHEGKIPAFSVEAFEEKPNAETAERFVAGGKHDWNSGIFVWSARTVLDGLQAHCPAVSTMVDRVVAAWKTPKRDAVLRKEYEQVERVSIDYALLEHAERIAVLGVEFEWNDVGSWSAIPELFGQDAADNTLRGGPSLVVDSRACTVQGDGRLIALLGVKDLLVVQTRDATLICHRDRVEEVKALVGGLGDADLDGYA